MSRFTARETFASSFVDSSISMSDNSPMSANLASDVLVDMQAVVDALATGRRVDEETYRRIRKRGESSREELRRKFGETDIAVDLIRETRDE